MNTQPPSPSDPSTSEEIDYADVVTLTAWMAQQGSTAEEIVDAVEKPWHYRDWIALAKTGAPMPDDA